MIIALEVWKFYYDNYDINITNHTLLLPYRYILILITLINTNNSTLLPFF